MGYVDENLISGEAVTYRAQLHWITLAMAGLMAAVSTILAFVLLANAFAGENPTSSPQFFLSLGLLAAGEAPLMIALIRKRASEFAVTNKRVIFKTGVVQRRTAEMFLNKIESVGVDQTIAGRLLGYGSIVIHGTGGSSEPFERIADPLQLRRQVQEQIAKL